MINVLKEMLIENFYEFRVGFLVIFSIFVSFSLSSLSDILVAPTLVNFCTKVVINNNPHERPVEPEYRRDRLGLFFPAAVIVDKLS